MAFGPPQAPPKRPKRFGWHRRFHQAQPGIITDRDGFWRVIAERAEARLTDVLCVKNYLEDCAGLTRERGYIGAFDGSVCAKDLDLDVAVVLGVVRVLIDVQWLSRDHRIGDWLDRQPEQEDATAADRQRRKRALDEARTRIATGIGSAEDVELIGKVEADKIAALAKASRVTLAVPEPAKAAPIPPFVPVRAKEDTHAAIEIAEHETERAARRWLLGDGTALVSYGPAATIVATNFRCTKLSADAIIRDWIKVMQQNVTLLATIISGAEQQALTGEAFRNVVEQRIEEEVALRTAGPKLPFGPTLQPGRKRA